MSKIIQTLFCWRSFPPEAVGECDSGGPLQGPTGPSLQSLLCLSVQFITTTPQCTLSAEQIHLSPSNHLEQTHCQLLVTEGGNRRGSEGLLDFQKETLACWRLQPPHGVKNNQHFDWLSRQTGALRERYLSAMFVQHPEKTRTCFVYMQGSSSNGEIISLFSKQSHKMWQTCHILWLHIKNLCSFPKDRHKFLIIFVLFNANLWINFKSFWISCREILRKTNVGKSESSFIRRNSGFLWGQIYVCRHVTEGNICSMYSHFGISLVHCIWSTSI